VFPPDFDLLKPEARDAMCPGWLLTVLLPAFTLRPQPEKPCVYAGSREPTAVYLAAFEKLCQQQKAGFHRFFAVFVGFFRFSC
jgi:hypothetical protein